MYIEFQETSSTLHMYAETEKTSTSVACVSSQISLAGGTANQRLEEAPVWFLQRLKG